MRAQLGVTFSTRRATQCGCNWHHREHALIAESLPSQPGRTNECERIVHRKTQSSTWTRDIGGIELQLVGGSQAPSVLLEGTPELEWANWAFSSVLMTGQRLADLLTRLGVVGARYCVFGGWLRDTLVAHGSGTPSPRDVDLVVAGVSVDALIAALPADICRTMFGGVQSSVGPVPFDIWPLHETFLIRPLSMPVSFQSLLQTADFNINAALYFPAQVGHAPAILDAGMLSAIRRRCLSFNASHLPFPLMQCSRVLAYAAKLDLALDPSVFRFVREMLGVQTNIEHVIDGLTRYQPHDVAEKAIASIRPITTGLP